MPAATTDPIRIRPALPGDIKTLHAMIVALARGTGDQHRVSSQPQDFLKHGFGKEPRFEALIAESSGTAIGLCLYFFTYSTWLGEPGIYVQDLYVTAAQRGKGVGRRLLAATAARGLAGDASHMRLSVAASNDAARKFYRRAGMELRDQEITYHLGGDAFAKLALE